jgi:transposase
MMMSIGVSDEAIAQMLADHARVVVERDQVTVERDLAVGEREQYRELYLRTLEQCRKLELGLVGPKSERLGADDAQLTMAVLGMLLGERSSDAAEAPELPATQPVREHERTKPTGRKPLPETLPRVEVQVLPEDVQGQVVLPAAHDGARR